MRCFWSAPRPPPFSQQHNGYLKNYQTTGKPSVLLFAWSF